MLDSFLYQDYRKNMIYNIVLIYFTIIIGKAVTIPVYYRGTHYYISIRLVY